MNPLSKPPSRRSYRTMPLITLLGLFSISPTVSGDPTWWTTRGVTAGTPASNRSPANIGQAKHVVSKALEELAIRLPETTHQALLDDLAQVVDLAIPDPLPPDFHEKQRVALVTGQLKAIAKPFYDHLRRHDPAWLGAAMAAAEIQVAEPGVTPPPYSRYPWTRAASDDANLAPATLGQLKAVFSLPFEALPDWTIDSDSDDLPDAWEIRYFGHLNFGPSDDPDHDGLTNDEELLIGTNPDNVDTDGDGITDNIEVANGTDPLVPETSNLYAGGGAFVLTPLTL